MKFRTDIKGTIESILESGPIEIDLFVDATKHFKEDSLYRNRKRMRLIITEKYISLPNDYWEKKSDKEKAIKDIKSAPRKKASRGIRFDLPDIQNTVCMFVQMSNGNLEMLINRSLSDDLLYLSPEKYKKVFENVLSQIQVEIKKAEEIIESI